MPIGVAIFWRFLNGVLLVGENGESTAHAAAANVPAGVDGSTKAEVTLGILHTTS